MPLSSEHAAMALQMFRKRAGSDRTVDRKVSQSWRTRSSRALAMAMAMGMVVVFVFMNFCGGTQQHNGFAVHEKEAAWLGAACVN